jgi:uncharacterized protein (TIGR03067 family)
VTGALLPSVIAVLCLSVSQAPGQKKATDLERLQGTWNDGDRIELVIKGNVLIAVARDGRGREAARARGSLVLDETARPRRIDLTSEKGPISPGIYMLDGDTLQLRFGKAAEDRPTSFDTEEGKSRTLTFTKQSRAKSDRKEGQP